MMNDTPATTGAASHPNDADVQQTAIDALIDDIHRFLADWQGRVNTELRSLRSSPPDAQVSQLRITAFEQQKRQWELHRARESQLIREQSDQLTNAWLQLEAEQRRLLQLKQDLRHPIASAPAPATLTRPLKSLPITNQTRDAAIRQFRQLQQEAGAADSTSSPS